MKSTRKYALIYILGLVGLLFMAVPRVAAQQDAPPIIGDADDNFNPPPCDFNDTFYAQNGIDTSKLDGSDAQRFGLFRKTGPPAFLTGQVNWVIDTKCVPKDPTRKNVRILATTGGYVDDGTGSPTEFISLIAFLTNQDFFLPAPKGFALPTPPAPPINDTNGNARHITMQNIVSNFEAYAALKQIDSVTHVFHTTACGLMGDPTQQNNCFDVTSVATPLLRQDWRFATNRNAIDGSDNNIVNGTTIVNDTPFGYFCDDQLGMWIITYFWFTDKGFGPGQTADCKTQLALVASTEGLSLDGTPIVKTADELNNQLEANGCGAEGKEDVGGADKGSIWLICPAIPDPRAGGIALDAFLDQVRKPNGVPLDLHFTVNFLSLQIFGVFPNELTAAQTAQLASAVTAAQ